MKKTVALMILGLIGQAASARTPMRDIRLQLTVEPLRLTSTLDYTTITVWGDGEVEGNKCIANSPTTPCLQKVVTRLTSAEREELENLIRAAALGQILPPNPHLFHCLAVPNQRVTYKANNGRILLQTGAVPCGEQTVNDSPAAKELVKKLNDLRLRFQQNQ